MYLLFHILLLFFINGHRCSASYNVDEVRNIIYEPDFVTAIAGVDPSIDLNALTADTVDEFKKRLLRDLPKEDDPNYVYMTSAVGQRFACSLPKIVQTEDDQSESYNPKYLSEIISASFYIKDCIQLDNGWWKYEVCRGKMVRQFHGAKNEAVQTENYLGMFTGSYAMPEFTKSTAERLLYVEELYDGGTPCDLDEKKIPRKTSVRYECDPLLPTNEAYILQVEEAASCEYVIRVKVGSLCKLKAFSPPNQSNALQISCQPYIAVDRINKYLQSIIDEKTFKLQAEAKVEELRNRMTSVMRRRAAMKRTELLRDTVTMKNVIRKRLAAEFEEVSTEFFLTAYRAQNGKNPTSEHARQLGRLTALLDADEMTYYDYPSDFDEDRGNIWYYFNDPTWKKSDFPKSLDYVDLLNEYFNRALSVIQHSILTTAETTEALRQLRGDPYKAEDNLLVTHTEIAEHLLTTFPQFLGLRKKDFSTDTRSDDISLSTRGLVGLLFVQEIISPHAPGTIFGGRSDEVTDSWIELIEYDLEGGAYMSDPLSDKELIELVAASLAPVYLYIKLDVIRPARFYEPLSSAELESIMTDGALMMDRLISAYRFVEASVASARLERKQKKNVPVPPPKDQDDYDEEEDLFTPTRTRRGIDPALFDRVYSDLVLKRKEDVYRTLMAEYKKELLVAMNASYSRAFDSVWFELSNKLLNDAKDKMDAVNRRERDSGSLPFGGFPVSTGAIGEKQVSGTELMELLAAAGLGRTSVKVQVLNLDELSEAMGKDEVAAIVDAQMEEFRAIQKTRDREKAYKTLLVDAEDTELATP